jgi:thiol-disulfide isomerase/thioredoxin
MKSSITSDLCAQSLRVCFSLLAGGMALCAQPSPTNDNFADRITLSGTDVTAWADNEHATREPGESQHAGNTGGKSVWWSWTAEHSGYLTVSTAGSISTNGYELDTLLAVYVGQSVSALTLVAENDDDSSSDSYTSMVVFRVTAGVAYQIAVDGYAFPGEAADGGTVVLSATYTETRPVHPAPVWQAPDWSGQTVQSTNFLGKVVLLNFWATWCDPCKQEIPDLIQLHNQYAGDGFSVIGVSIDAAVGGEPPYALISQFVGDNRIPYPVLLSRPGSTMEADFGGITNIPTTVIIDRENTIVARVVGSRSKAEFEQMVLPALYADLKVAVQRQPGEVRIAWPMTGALFILESSDSPSSLQWSPVSEVATSSDGAWRVTLPCTGQARFYRLKMP